MQIQQGKGANRSSALSLEISDVMESFDFLDSEDTQSSSHYESLDNSLEEAKIVFTPQLDETLLIHLSYCRHLVDVTTPFRRLVTRISMRFSRYRRSWAATDR